MSKEWSWQSWPCTHRELRERFETALKVLNRDFPTTRQNFTQMQFFFQSTANHNSLTDTVCGHLCSSSITHQLCRMWGLNCSDSNVSCNDCYVLNFSLLVTINALDPTWTSSCGLFVNNKITVEWCSPEALCNWQHNGRSPSPVKQTLT